MNNIFKGQLEAAEPTIRQWHYIHLWYLLLSGYSQGIADKSISQKRSCKIFWQNITVK